MPFLQPFLDVAPSSAAAQSSNSREIDVRQLIRLAEIHYAAGQHAYDGGEMDRARREFDEAMDSILLASVDVRSDDQLRIYYRELIEKINRHQITALEQRGSGFSEQRYEPSPLDKLASLSDAELAEAAVSDEEIARNAFNFDFSAAAPVRQFIGYFTKGRGRATLEAGFQRSVRYRGMAEKIFKEEGVPTDLIWLAQVESGWNPYALSSAGAKGVWQFVPSTASRFGLQQNYWIDERSNPEKSTRAAARYLKFLGARYHGNWELALAAYNSGERHVDSAIARLASKDFWSVRQVGLLPQETRNYVPAILAVVAIAKDPKRYGLEVPATFPLKYVTHTITKQTELRQLARNLKLSYGTLLDLNPELQRGSTPPGRHLIKIPANNMAGGSEEEKVKEKD